MWHGPFGVYGWWHDEEADEPRQHLVNLQAYLHGIPRALICRRFGHRPVVDGYGVAGGDPSKPWREAKRWVTCGRCDTRPDWQGDLPPALWPTLGAPYTGEWTTKMDFDLQARASQQARERWYRESREWHEANPDPETADASTRPMLPESLLPAWPAASWQGSEEHPGPRGAVSVQLLVWQRKRRDWPGYGVGFSIGAGERPLKLHVHGGKLGSVYLGFEDYGRALAHRILGRDLPHTREFEVDFTPADRTLRWEIAARKGEWASKDPRWMHGRIDFADLVLGKLTSNSNTIDQRDVVIPMPEGSYPAHVELIRIIRRRARWSRPQTYYRYDITPVCGIPVPGKGENSYDCDDDATYSQSGPSKGPGYGSEWVTEAVSGISEGVLRARSRYGSGLAWVPDKGWPEQVLSV